MAAIRSPARTRGRLSTTAILVTALLGVPLVLHAPPARATTPAQPDQPPITTFSDPQHRFRSPRSVAFGPDGNLWFTAADDLVGRFTPDGEVTVFKDWTGRVDSPDAIVAGPDGALWFTGLHDLIGRITTEGYIATFPVGDRAELGPLGLAAGPTATCGSPRSATASDESLPTARSSASTSPLPA
jgi:streptogramin lyase